MAGDHGDNFEERLKDSRIKSQEKISLNYCLLILESNLHVEAEMHHIPINHHISFTFNT